MKKMLLFCLISILCFFKVTDVNAAYLQIGVDIPKNYVNVCEYTNEYKSGKSHDISILFDINTNQFVAYYMNVGTPPRPYSALFINDSPVEVVENSLNNSSTICPNYAYIDFYDGFNPDRDVCFDNDGKYCVGKDRGLLEFTQYGGTSQKTYDINDEVSSVLNGFDYEYEVPELEELDNFQAETLADDVKEAIDNYLINNLTLRNRSTTIKMTTVYSFIRNTEVYKNRLQSELEKANTKIDNYLNALSSAATTDEEKAQINRVKAKVNASFDSYISHISINTDIPLADSDSCEGYLGSVDDPNAPAYYLDKAFDIIKYLAIILLFVLSIVEYFKALTSGDQDAMKKATQKTIKRVIMAVIIFIAPILIEFILSVLGIVGYGTCGIG